MHKSLLLLLPLPLLAAACAEPMVHNLPNDPIQDALFPGDPALVPQPPGPFVNPHSYTVSIHTGNRDHAGTNANVYVMLVGKNDESVDILLNDPQRDDFERNSTSTFTFDYANRLGDLQAIWLRQDNTGFDPAWYVDSVTVTDNASHQSYRADVHEWLSLTDQPRQLKIYRPLNPITP